MANLVRIKFQNSKWLKIAFVIFVVILIGFGIMNLMKFKEGNTEEVNAPAGSEIIRPTATEEGNSPDDINTCINNCNSPEYSTDDLKQGCLQMCQ